MMEDPYHCFFRHSKDRALGHRGRRGHAKRLSREASLTKKIPAYQDSYDRLFPARGSDRQLDLTLLNVKNRVRGTALREDDLLLSILLICPPLPGFRKVRPEIEWWCVFFPCHERPPIRARIFAMDFRRQCKLAQWLGRS